MTPNRGNAQSAYASFTLLPAARPRWKAFGASAGIEFFLILLLLWIPLLMPQKMIPLARYSVMPLIATRPVTEWKPQPPPKFKVAPPPVSEDLGARVMAPPLVAPRTRPREAPKPVAPLISPRFEPVLYKPSEPARPRPEVRTGVLGGSSAPATIPRPAVEVQTGGFGDPEGVPAVGNSTRAATIGRVGSFDLPPGEGYGNGSGGARGTVASAGFGNGVATPVAASSQPAAKIQRGLFAAQNQPVAASRARAAADTPLVQPVEILAKPNPVYTAEARALHLEGEVLLSAVFTASGEVRVLRVVRGLGHGLDEAAIAAARQIRFRPERVNGRPVDTTATVHIVFQLAY